MSERNLDPLMLRAVVLRFKRPRCYDCQRAFSVVSGRQHRPRSRSVDHEIHGCLGGGHRRIPEDPRLAIISRANSSSASPNPSPPSGDGVPKKHVVQGIYKLFQQLGPMYDLAANSRYGRLMRLDKPIGTNLLFLPTAWGISIVASSIPDALALYGLTYAGAVIMRGAGCTMNDLWDEDIDRRVERTRSRPIAAGEISIPAAFTFLGAQLCAGLAVLLSLNNYAIVTGAPSVIPVLLYPLAKRVTDYPQAVLGLTINWGALVGYAAASESLAPTAFCLYGAGWCWTMIYDTIYAHQDKRDDAQIGVKSAALALGARTKPALAVLGCAKVGLLAAAGYCGDLSSAYYAGIALTGGHIARQISTTNLDDPKECMTAFASNATTGTITWLAIVAGRLL